MTWKMCHLNLLTCRTNSIVQHKKQPNPLNALYTGTSEPQIKGGIQRKIKQTQTNTNALKQAKCRLGEITVEFWWEKKCRVLQMSWDLFGPHPHDRLKRKEKRWRGVGCERVRLMRRIGELIIIKVKVWGGEIKMCHIEQSERNGPG